ncbi:MAG: LemA family protein [Bacteroidales bacterium]|nr:LemA family protein [Bacteroidales bacterium]
MTGIIITVVVVLLIVVWVIGVQRNLVSSDELCSNAMSQIGVQQESRWDAVTNLVEMIKGYNEHEYKTLKDIIAQRADIKGNSSAADVEAQEGHLAQLASQLKVVVERYPDLKANETFLKGMDSINMYENQVRTSRMVYNDTVTKYNRIVRSFPNSIVASIFHFSVKDYLKDPGQKAQAPVVSFK